MKTYRQFTTLVLLSISLLCFAQSNQPLKISQGGKYVFGADVSEGSIYCSEHIYSTVSKNTFFYLGYDSQYDCLSLEFEDKTGGRIIGKYVYSMLEKEMPGEIIHMMIKPVTFILANGKSITHKCELKAMFRYDKIEYYDFEIKDIDLSDDNKTFRDALLGSNIKTIKIGIKTISFVNSRTAPTIKKMRQFKICDVSGEISGHNYVDLGLPSGLKWATQNVGASSPKEYGDYYAWGETSTKDNYSREAWQYNGLQNVSDVPDVASYKWGGSWRLPTLDELRELDVNCKWEWTGDGIKGTGPNGKTIYLPASGEKYNTYTTFEGERSHFWTSSICKYDEDGLVPWSFECTNDEKYKKYYTSIQAYVGFEGYPVRPVAK